MQPEPELKSGQKISILGWYGHCSHQHAHWQLKLLLLTLLKLTPRGFPFTASLPPMEMDRAASPVISRSNSSLCSFESISSDSKSQQIHLISHPQILCMCLGFQGATERQKDSFPPRHVKFSTFLDVARQRNYK